MVNNCINFVRSCLYPPTCILCGDTAGFLPEYYRGHSVDLCGHCQSELPYNNHACIRCATPLTQSSATVCGACQRKPPAFERSLGLLRYLSPVDRLIHAFKFAGQLHIATVLGELMAGRILDTNVPLPELLIPVPLHPIRLRERGFNQALELARVISNKLTIPIDYRSCERSRMTVAQSLLPAKERHQNIKGAFTVHHPFKVKSVAIIDDVMTTGHTVNELASVLKDAGVDHVQVWAVARANT